jgi:hypothetical protein
MTGSCRCVIRVVREEMMCCEKVKQATSCRQTQRYERATKGTTNQRSRFDQPDLSRNGEVPGTKNSPGTKKLSRRIGNIKVPRRNGKRTTTYDPISPPRTIAYRCTQDSRQPSRWSIGGSSFLEIDDAIFHCRRTGCVDNDRH